MPKTTLGIAILAAGILLLEKPAAGMIFEDVDSKLTGGRKVLWARDCGYLAQDKARTCKEWDSMISGKRPFLDGHRIREYEGDAEILRQHLRWGYDEVWLYSGGGDLNEGLKMGEILRRAKMTVRVPNGARCISACTVAFLGGLFRFVDDGATYEVHAYSRFLGDMDSGWKKELRNRLLTEPAGELERFAAEERSNAKDWAARLFRYCQGSILLPTQVPASEVLLSNWARQHSQSNPYSNSPQHSADVGKIKSEGEAAIPTVLMRIERDCMDEALRQLRAIEPELGPRAKFALNMLDAMFSSQIVRTASLSRDTLRSMGYTTTVLEFQGAK
jgi:hypothetical protein